jgi:hypothetical protein
MSEMPAKRFIVADLYILNLVYTLLYPGYPSVRILQGRIATKGDLVTRITVTLFIFNFST